ncbi:MAG: ATP-binding protein [Bacteroidales bacterium]
MVSRIIKNEIIRQLKPGLVIGLFGARRTGKTVLMEEIRNDLTAGKVLLIHGENLDVAEIISSQRTSILKRYLAGYDMLFIDEAQKIPNIGQNLKLIVDTLPEIGIFVTGSSAFDLRQKIGEPLTGRSRNYFLFPFSQVELNESALQAKENLETRLIYGYYPRVVLSETNKDKIEELESIKNGYLLRDILELDNLKDSLFILNLLRLLAFQIGNDISLSELANTLHVSRKTVVRYLEFLEKCYVIFSLHGFSRNLRKEFSKSPRFYFWDNGIRNAVISNFNQLAMRDDIGRLWENYCISERRKRNHYLGRLLNYYFWRTYDQKEIDLIEESGGILNGFEIKWSEKKVKPPKEFLETYKNSVFEVITRENWLDFIT